MKSIKPLEAPDSHYLRSAMGWLELGNPGEAGEEIARINPDRLEHPAVLQVRWEICVRTNSWPAALELAELQLRLFPTSVEGWVHRAYATRRIPGGGLERAYEALRPGRVLFPNEPVIPYNLACYTAQMGRLNEAWEWLQAAAAVGGPKQIKEMARRDPDLEALHGRLHEL